jgi:peptide/nickel transport system ATP-binding protein
VADRVLVMYAGRPVEVGSVEEIYYEPRMPYTLGLLGSLPRLDSSSRERLTPIVGSPPSLVNMPPGCPFAPRCPLHIAECDAAEPALFQVGPGHTAACIRTDVVAGAHGNARAVFDETSSDAVLAGEPLPADVAVSPDGAEEATPGGTPPPEQTEPAAGPADETGTISSPRGGQA